MNIEVKREEGNVTVKMNVRLDSTTAPDLDKVLQEEAENVKDTLTVDLKNVDFVSSIGLRVLVAAYRKLDGKDMIISGANSSVLEVLKLSGLLKIFKTEG